ncbi:MAG: helix-turn-helix transcriptional regulator [Phascolarctobacterium sp.]|nr:helix-turn-helix transcriptional regulator [Phascolarctobacterium sp.]
MNICKQLREALGLTIGGLAKESKMASTTLKFYETGGSVTQRSVEKLAAFFGVEPDELAGHKSFDIDAWIKTRSADQSDAEESASLTPVIQRQEPELHQRGIVQLIRVSSAAANYYLAEGWILLDTAPMKNEEGFYCLLGSTKVLSSEEFASIKSKKAPRAKGYWMSKP